MPTPDAVAAAMTAKRYEAFWIRGAGWTFCASEPDTEDATIDIELVPAADHATLQDALREAKKALKNIWPYVACTEECYFSEIDPSQENGPDTCDCGADKVLNAAHVALTLLAGVPDE